MIKTIGLALQQRFSRWVHRRIPPSNKIFLDNKNLFIFPSNAGFGFLFLTILCWLVATNYENNVVFAVTCLLISFFLVAILHSFINVSGLTVSYLRAEPAFAGENVIVELVLSQKHRRYRDALSLCFEGGEETVVSMQDQTSVRVRITVLAPKRGRYLPGRIHVESSYPLGLLRVWTKIDLDISTLVYPKPVFDIRESLKTSARGEGALQLDNGSEDFIGLNNYQPGDSLKRIAWKQYAREQGLYAKHYADYQDERIWLDWDSLPGLDRESRLSVLCGMLLRVSSTNQHYGLRLPSVASAESVEIAPDSGEQHKNRILKELALFEDDVVKVPVTSKWTKWWKGKSS